MSFRIIIISFFIILGCSSLIYSQHDSDTTGTKEFKAHFFGYADVFYCQDLNNPFNKEQLFSSNPYRVNQFGLDYSFFQANFKQGKLEANFALNFGSIVDVMYINEPLQYKFIREASFKYHISKKWSVEAGIMPALFGFETFINANNMHATRAVMCDFAPDFAAGITVAYKINEHWTNKFQINNGWQVLQETNKSKAFANVLIYENEKNKNLLNLGVIVTDESADTSKAQPRIYSNNFAKLHFGKWTVAPMFDVGFQKAGDLTDNHDDNAVLGWYSTALSVRYAVASKFGVAARYERMIDPHGIVPEVRTRTANGFQMDGATLTFEFLPTSSSVFRIEGRYKNSKDAIFSSEKQGVFKNDDLTFFVSFATFFNKSRN